MKKTLSVLAVLCLLITQKTTAQLEPGNVIVGADLANFRIALKSGQETSLQLTPNALWMLNSNLAIGAYVTLGYSAVKDAYTNTTYGVGPMARYYFNDPKLNLLKHGRWFGQANVGIGGLNYNDKSAEDNDRSTNGLDIGFGPGYAYFITQNIAFETLLRYNGTLGFGHEAYTNYLNLHFGFQVYLPGKATLNKVKSQEGM